MKNAFTIDLEDWYQGIALPTQDWDCYEKRISVGTDKLLSLLQKNKVTATFFTLGKVIEEHPSIIKQLIQEGHEIGCHTNTHPALYNITEREFELEIRQCATLLKDNFDLIHLGFRAPFFSVDRRSWWALDVLKKNGYLYDSSIYPGDNKRTGIVNYEKNIHYLENGMVEVPISTFKFLKYDVGLGGAYFRILPYNIFKSAFRQLNKNRQAGIFYIHPWELDPGHPNLRNLPKRIKYTHYFNLAGTERKLERLLGDFEFVPLKELVLQFKNSFDEKGNNHI